MKKITIFIASTLAFGTVVFGFSLNLLPSQKVLQQYWCENIASKSEPVKYVEYTIMVPKGWQDSSEYHLPIDDKTNMPIDSFEKGIDIIYKSGCLLYNSNNNLLSLQSTYLYDQWGLRESILENINTALEKDPETKEVVSKPLEGDKGSKAGSLVGKEITFVIESSKYPEESKLEIDERYPFLEKFLDKGCIYYYGAIRCIDQSQPDVVNTCQYPKILNIPFYILGSGDVIACSERNIGGIASFNNMGGHSLTILATQTLGISAITSPESLRAKIGTIDSADKAKVLLYLLYGYTSGDNFQDFQAKKIENGFEVKVITDGSSFGCYSKITTSEVTYQVTSEGEITKIGYKIISEKKLDGAICVD